MERSYRSDKIEVEGSEERVNYLKKTLIVIMLLCFQSSGRGGRGRRDGEKAKKTEVLDVGG
jgi:hypothetical protein